MESVTEFDVWTSDDGAIKATPACTQFVQDSDAPYGYSNHQIRLNADTAKSAIREYRKLIKG